MENYTTFKEIINRVKYGTKISVKEAFTNNDVYCNTWEYSNKVESFNNDILDAEVTGFSIKDDTLLIEIVKQN